ncbi:hypothetical protein Cni_G02899 [Canna indica]|uniref:SPRY domain-containing protein n=1 Tax=Canna indica TaxID=4628 RepID=A0AAQ3JQS2_9LILI|nr:hypothetical protein Cni_G02899 [Canna indica]
MWIKILLPLIAFALVVLLPILLLCRRRHRQLIPRSASPELAQSVTKARSQSLHDGIAKLQHSYRSSTGRKTSLLFHHHHHHHRVEHGARGGDPAPFIWDDHPRLVVEAVENGWARFMFVAGRQADSFPGCCAPVVWGMWDGGSAQQQQRGSVETNWEVTAGASEFLQTVRLSPKPRRSSTSSPLLVHAESISMAKMLLPLPGPPLGFSSFPQEAYFEITILYLKPPPSPPLQQQQQWSSRRRAKADAGRESDRAKLIREDPSEAQSTLPIAADLVSSPIQESKPAAKEEGVNNQSHAILSLGLSHGGTLPGGSLAGTFRGSIGFHSNGSVFLDGTKLVFESEKAEWAEVNRVIGCGFDPSKKKVFFTVDSELLHVIHCNSDKYKAPLFPVLATNTDAMFLVNLGQSKFRYEPANAHRTRNPCFIRSSSIDPGAGLIGEDDSRELFSMGRIDSEWLEAAKKSQSSSKKSNVNNFDAGSAADVDADSDLFEISLHI